MTAKKLRQEWSSGRVVFGLWAALPSAFAAELMCGPDVGYICVDQQHGLIDYTDAVAMYTAIQARGSTPITRVPANEAWMIGKNLDAGAQGVIVPMVNSREEAEAAVRACRYPPDGIRSFGPIRAAVVGESRDTISLGKSMLCFVMVETREALRNIDEIASTPGLDGIYIGPADLALGLGLPPDLDKTEEEHVKAVHRILQACVKNAIAPGIQCGSGAAARKYAEAGFKLITVGKDTALLQKAAKAEMAAAMGEKIVGSKNVGYT